MAQPTAPLSDVPSEGPAPDPMALGPPTGSGFAPTPIAKPPKGSGGWGFWIAILVTIAIVGGAVAYTTLESSSAKPTVLLKNGTGIEIPAGEFYAGPLMLSKTATLSGSLDSGRGVVVYVMNPSTYNVFQSTGRTYGSEWNSGAIFNGSFDVYLNPGSWEVVFQSPNPDLPTEFITTSAVTATPS
jgi:hypothetical protein